AEPRDAKRGAAPAQFALARAHALLVELGQLERDHLRDAGVVHRYAVEHVGGFDRPAVVRDDDELRTVRQLAQRLREPSDIPLVERGIDLVEDTERRGLHAEDREEKRGRGERALAAGQVRERADALTRRPRIDVDARLLRIIGDAQARLPTVEEPLEEDAELAIDGHERRAE